MAYVYRHIRLDTNQPFYIGIGIDNKGKYYRANNRHGRNNYWKNIVKKTNYEIEILFEHEDKDLIKQKEIEFIKLYGRIDIKTGILVNMTDGGDGCFNHVCSDETKEKLRIANKGEKNPMWGKKSSEKQKAILSEKFKGKKRPDLSGSNNVNFGKKKPLHSLKLKGRKYPERSQRFKGDKNPNYGKKHTEEARKKISEKLKGRLVGEKNPMWGVKRDSVGELNKKLKGKKILDTKTAIIYNSIKEASMQCNIPLSTLKGKLHGKYKNNTTLIYFKDDKN